MKQLQTTTLALLLPFSLATRSSRSSLAHKNKNALRHTTTTTTTDTNDDYSTAAATIPRKLEETTTCQSDQDCDGLMQYCSKGLCRFHGTCDTITECYNPSNQYFLPACLGYLLCSSDGFCDIECGDSPCPPDSFTVECFEDPCQAQTCNVANTRCVETFCDGCNAIFFDSAGNHVCDPESQSTTDAPPSPTESSSVPESVVLCTSDQDCSTPTTAAATEEEQQQYCRQGECHNVGTCSTFADCLNPGNVHSFEEDCFGYQTCSSSSSSNSTSNDDGRCRLECTDSPCPPGVSQVRCLSAPCDVENCDQVPDARCVNDYCGGCNAYFFDAAGHPVCQKDDDFGTSDVPPCSSDLECNRLFEYCSRGECHEFGSCRTLSDCLNPSNLYEVEECEGYMSCDDGRCAVTCSDSQCPPGETVPVCNDLPCNVKQCEDDPDARCADYLCGDCRAIFFDTAGNEVCSSLVNQTECQSDQDCTGENEICVDGSCWVEEQEEQPQQPTQPSPTQSPPDDGPCPCPRDQAFLPRFMCILRNMSLCV